MKSLTPDRFIEVNRTYPGTHHIEIMNVWSKHDQWEHTDTVISEVSIHPLRQTVRRLRNEN